MKKKIAVIAIISLALLNMIQFFYTDFDFKDSHYNVVGDEGTAIAVARAVLQPTYGSSISQNEPYSVRDCALRRRWIVSAALTDDSDAPGGTVTVTICKNKGRILEISRRE